MSKKLLKKAVAIIASVTMIASAAVAFSVPPFSSVEVLAGDATNNTGTISEIVQDLHWFRVSDEVTFADGVVKSFTRNVLKAPESNNETAISGWVYIEKGSLYYVKALNTEGEVTVNAVNHTEEFKINLTNTGEEVFKGVADGDVNIKFTYTAKEKYADVATDEVIPTGGGDSEDIDYCVDIIAKDKSGNPISGIEMTAEGKLLQQQTDASGLGFSVINDLKVTTDNTGYAFLGSKSSGTVKALCFKVGAYGAGSIISDNGEYIASSYTNTDGTKGDIKYNKLYMMSHAAIMGDLEKENISKLAGVTVDGYNKKMSLNIKDAAGKNIGTIVINIAGDGKDDGNLYKNIPFTYEVINEASNWDITLEFNNDADYGNITGYKTISVVATQVEEKKELEYTTEPVKLRVGDIWRVDNANIDAMISDEVAKLNKDESDFYVCDDEEVKDIMFEYDNTYLKGGFAYSYYVKATNEVVYTNLMTYDELHAFLEEYNKGNMVYNGMTLGYGEGYDCGFTASIAPSYIRAEKAGSTKITIPYYQVGTDGNDKPLYTMKVTVPIVIEDVDGGDDDTNSGEPSSTITSTTDDKIVIDNVDKILPAGTTLKSAKLESGDVLNNAKKLITESLDNLGSYAVYELDLYNAENVAIHQLDGKIKVTMDIPFELAKGSNLKVFRVDDDKLTECVSTVADGKVTFETDHFSTYILSEQTQEKAPDTGDNSNIGLYVVILLMGSAIMMVTFRKKMIMY